MSGAQSSGAPQVCNTASIKDTKYFCDDAIERVGSTTLTKLLTQRPSAERTPSAKGKEKSTVEFAPFQASHTVDDVLMAVSLTGSVIMLGTVGYVYLKKVEWPIARQYYLVAVSTFAVLFALQSAIKYFAGPLVFRGTRKMLSNRVRALYADAGGSGISPDPVACSWCAESHERDGRRRAADSCTSGVQARGVVHAQEQRWQECPSYKT